MNAFLESQFNFCPLLWICCNRSLNNEINRLHERCVRMVCNNELFERDGSASIRHENIEFSTIEIFKVFKGIRLQIVTEIYHFRDAML